MKKLTDEELRKAFRYWLMKYTAREAEEPLRPFLSEKIKPFVIGEQGQLKTARKGLFLSAATVAAKLKVARAAYSKYEECEERGAVTMATLAKAAEAMDCELVYAIRPKSKKNFSNIIWAILLPPSLLHPWIKKCDPKKRGEALAHIANKFMNDPGFRKKQGWSQRANKSNHAHLLNLLQNKPVSSVSFCTNPSVFRRSCPPDKINYILCFCRLTRDLRICKKMTS